MTNSEIRFRLKCDNATLREVARMLAEADGQARWEEFEARVVPMAEVLTDLRDDNPCRYDHHGHCQEHGWMETDPPCPQKRLKAILTSLYGDRPQDTPAGD